MVLPIVAISTKSAHQYELLACLIELNLPLSDYLLKPINLGPYVVLPRLTVSLLNYKHTLTHTLSHIFTHIHTRAVEYNLPLYIPARSQNRKSFSHIPLKVHRDIDE